MIHFDNGKGCGNQAFDFESICHQAPKSNGAGRDKHGKLLSNDISGFVSISYGKVRRTADSCINDELADMHEDCFDKSKGKQDSKYFECRVTKRKDAIKACNRFGPIQTALELVFGTQTSPGFICGIKDAIVNDGVPMPGQPDRNRSEDLVSKRLSLYFGNFLLQAPAVLMHPMKWTVTPGVNQ